ncbi:MAG: hypothetical protein VX009_03340 [Pseudomonadota bacterium]|nr:hypothetical protein [Pseudomonadota bacterium]
MLNLISNIRFDRIKRDHNHSFKKNLDNYTNSELGVFPEKNSLDTQLSSTDWINLYRKQ